MQRAKNPILNSLDKQGTYDVSNASTYLGISIKTGILLLMTFLSAGAAWFMLQGGQFDAALTIFGATALVSIISVLIASFVPRLAMPFSLLYTLAQGFSLGVLTYIVELMTDGAGFALIALVITIVIFGIMLALYSSRTLRATPKFRKVMMTIIFGILIFSILTAFIPALQLLFIENTLLGILLSVGLIVYGAFMLVLNFDQAEVIVTNGLDKQYEWNVSLGLMITLIWIYVEVLRLLIILFANRE